MWKRMCHDYIWCLCFNTLLLMLEAAGFHNKQPAPVRQSIGHVLLQTHTFAHPLHYHDECWVSREKHVNHSDAIPLCPRWLSLTLMTFCHWEDTLSVGSFQCQHMLLRGETEILIILNISIHFACCTGFHALSLMNIHQDIWSCSVAHCSLSSQYVIHPRGNWVELLYFEPINKI